MYIDKAKTKKELLNFVKGDYDKARIIKGNTLRVNYSNGDTGIIYHETQIVLIKANGNIELNNGDYFTRTTKDRMNEYTNLRLHQEKSRWYVNGHLYYNGITFNDTGQLLTEDITPDTVTGNKLLKKLKAFSNQLLTMEVLPVPDGGDCWLCMMPDNNNNEHLIQHIGENYLHGTLLVNAMTEAGYPIENIGLHYSMNLRDNFKRALHKYLKKRLYIGQEKNYKAILEQIETIESEVKEND